MASHLHLYLIRIHSDYSRFLCLVPAQLRAITRAERAPYFLRKETFTVLLLYSAYCRRFHSFRNHVDKPECFLFSVPLCLTYSSIGPLDMLLVGPTPFSDFPYRLFPLFSSRSMVERVPDQRIWSSHTLTNLFTFYCDSFVFLKPRVSLSARELASFVDSFWRETRRSVSNRLASSAYSP